MHEVCSPGSEEEVVRPFRLLSLPDNVETESTGYGTGWRVMKRALLVGMGLVLVGGTATPVVTPTGASSAAAVAREAMPFDFDGDGYADLAVGVPGEDVRGVKDAGVVQVLYGSASGVSARDQVWHQGRKGITNKLEKRDRFGSSLTSGDFDGDGFADLAVGIPFENVGSVRDAGAVQVLYGGPRGLTARDQVWHQGKPGVPGSNEPRDGFGDALAAGDFDADGYADLVIGSPDEAVGGVEQAGRVVVLRGGPGGLTASGAQSLRQGRGGVPSQPARAIGSVRTWPSAMSTVTASTTWPSSSGPSRTSRRRGRGVWTAARRCTCCSEARVASPQTEVSTSCPPGCSPTRISISCWPSAISTGTEGRTWCMASADGPVGVLHGHPDGLHVAPLPLSPQPGEDGWWGAGMGEEGLGINVAAGDVTGDGNADVVVEWGRTVARSHPRHRRRALDDIHQVGRPECGVRRHRDPAVQRGQSRLAGGHALPGGVDNPGSVSVLRGTSAGTPGRVTIWSQDSPGIRDAAERGDGFGYPMGAE